jgi:hypothetical protein
MKANNATPGKAAQSRHFVRTRPSKITVRSTSARMCPTAAAYVEADTASPTAAWPAASRAVSTRYGEQLT